MSETDHRENIREAAQRYTAGARERVTEEAMEAGEELAYDVEVWRSNHGRVRVEFLLAGGGPTVWVVVDEHERVTFHHSWGEHDGADRHEWPIVGEDAVFWHGQAEDFEEMMAEVK